eukprot:365721-Chlamydomonas_euryale.AAC.17
MCYAGHSFVGLHARAPNAGLLMHATNPAFLPPYKPSGIQVAFAPKIQPSTPVRQALSHLYVLRAVVRTELRRLLYDRLAAMAAAAVATLLWSGMRCLRGRGCRR